MSLTKPKVVVVMPAYNAAETLRMTYAELPHDAVDLVIVVDDGSSDHTAAIARELGLELFVHNRNYGYGANQKTCYREALRAGADIIVMVHPDYQYDPTLLPDVIRPIQEGKAEVVLGSRLLGGHPMASGMPWWKFAANRFLTKLENAIFGLSLAEYHTGYRAFSSVGFFVMFASVARFYVMAHHHANLVASEARFFQILDCTLGAAAIEK